METEVIEPQIPEKKDSFNKPKKKAHEAKTTQDIFKTRWRNILIISSVISAIAIFCGYLAFLPEISEGLEIENMEMVLIVVPIRTMIMGILSYIIFNNWLSQKNAYLTDIPFLLGIFFITITFGKALDLLHNLVHFTASPEELLMLMRIRYFIIVATAAPLLYLGFPIFFIWLGEKRNITRLKDKEVRENMRNKLIIGIIAIESIAILMVPSESIMGLLLPFILFPALLLTAGIFWFAFKNKLLSQVNTRLLFIGFSAYILSSIMRPLFQWVLIGETPIYILFAEAIDIVIFIVIYIGLITGDRYT